MNPKYANNQNRDQIVAHFIEECGESLAAVGKGVRFGFASVNPELPPEEQEPNYDWVLRELLDLQRSITFLQKEMWMVKLENEDDPLDLFKNFDKMKEVKVHDLSYK